MTSEIVEFKSEIDIYTKIKNEFGEKITGQFKRTTHMKGGTKTITWESYVGDNDREPCSMDEASQLERIWDKHLENYER